MCVSKTIPVIVQHPITYDIFIFKPFFITFSDLSVALKNYLITKVI